MISFDIHSLLAYSLITTVNSQSGTTLVVTLQTGNGSLFHTNQQVTIWPPSTDAYKSNAMIGRVTGIMGDQLTIDYSTNNNEGANTQSVQDGWQIANTLTPKALTDIEACLGGGATIVIAASNASQASKNRADRVCTGTKDQDVINAAIAALPSSGGSVMLTEGDFWVDNSINLNLWNINLIGQGNGTLIHQSNGANVNCIINLGGYNIAQIYVSNLNLEGNKSNNTYGGGINMDTTNSSNSWVILENIVVYNTPNNAFNWTKDYGGGSSSYYINNCRATGSLGNGFYSGYSSGVALTDSVFNSCISDTNALNGFYLATLDTHFEGCKAYFNGSAGGSNHGYYIAGYNNYFTGCQAQDNYGCGFFLNNDGDPTYGTQNNTFVNCDADTNNNPSNSRGATTSSSPTGYGWYINNTKGTTLIGCQGYVRPYPFAWGQNYGVYLAGTTTGTYTTGLSGTGNSILLYQDSSSGVNYFVPAESSAPYQSDRGFDVRSYGAARNGRRVFGITANSGSQTITASSSVFTASDVGKAAIVFNDSGQGTVTTIQSYISGTQVTLAANAGITTTSSTGYIIYGTDDSGIIQRILTLAGTLVNLTNTTDPNQPMGTGHIRVTLPGGYPHSMYVIGSQLTIPSGVDFDCQGTIANLLTSRNAPCVQVNPYAIVNRIDVENVFGTGISCGTLQNQAHIILKEVRVWHSAGSSSAPSGLSATPSNSGGTLSAGTRYYVVTAIDASGGETPVSSEVSSTTTGSTGSCALTWTAFSGAVSYRIYRGTTSGLQNLYFTSATNSFTDTGGASVDSYPPVSPGFGLQLQGYHFELGKIYIKVAKLGIYHNFGGDCNVANAFIVGCNTGIRINGGGQIDYLSILLDTCGTVGGTGSYGGIMIDDGSNIRMRGQVFQNSAASNSLPQVVSIGNYNTNSAQPSIDIELDIQANNTGGSGLKIQNAKDVRVKMLLSNTVFSATDPITTGVVYGPNLAGELDIEAVLSTGITPSSGTQYGNYQYIQGGVRRFTNPPTMPNFKTGLATISGGATQFGIPGATFINVGTTTINANEVRYLPFLISYPVTLSELQLEVTTAPGANANVAVGLYKADSNMQPTGAPLYDSGSIAVASGFTGVKTVSGLNIALTPGMYLVAINTDTSMALRTFTTPAFFITTTMGSTPFIQRVIASQTFGAYPNPGTAWTSTNASGSGIQHSVAFQWTDNA